LLLTIPGLSLFILLFIAALFPGSFTVLLAAVKLKFTLQRCNKTGFHLLVSCIYVHCKLSTPDPLLSTAQYVVPITVQHLWHFKSSYTNKYQTQNWHLWALVYVSTSDIHGIKKDDYRQALGRPQSFFQGNQLM